jgi:DNA-binding MarR family transcriptional regulator
MRVVRRSKAAEILLALLKAPKHVRELQAEVGGSALTVDMRIQELLKEGCIEEERSEVWPFRKTLRLANRGREMAMLLKLETSLLVSPPKVSAEKAKEKGKWLLALLHAAGGAVEGSTRLQKLCFLLKREFGLSELPYNFLPFLHGPFSTDINDDALDLEIAGLIEVERGMVEPTLYVLTPKGRKVAKEIYKKIPEKGVLSRVRRFNQMGLVELLKYVYAKYPKESKV